MTILIRAVRLTASRCGILSATRLGTFWNYGCRRGETIVRAGTVGGGDRRRAKTFRCD